MVDNIPDAPWIGKHKEDTKRIVGYCIYCDQTIYDGDTYDYDGEFICEDCLNDMED